jgi:glycosyltransferase involved in cell wall biosynthesis
MPVESLIVVSDSASIDGGSAKVAIDTALIMSEGLDVAMFAGGASVDPRLAQDVRVSLTGDLSIGAGHRSAADAFRGIWNRRTKTRFDRFLRQYDPDTTVVHVHSWGSRLSPSVFASLRQQHFATVVTAHDYLLGCPNACRYVFPEKKICELSPGTAACVVRRCDRVSYAAKVFRLARYLTQVATLRRLRPVVAYVSSFQQKNDDHFLPFEHNTHVVDNPVALPSHIPEYSGFDGPFLTAARLEKEKGVDVFCNSLGTTEFAGTVLGDGTEREQLEKQYPLVDFLGWMAQEQIHSQMLSARALVFPSRWLEAAPLTPLEAQIVAGLPCIVSDACAAQNMIEDGVTGFVFKSDDHEDLTRCLRKVSDPAVHAELRRNIVDRLPRMRQRYAAATYRSNILDVYEGALAAGSGRSR